MNGRNYININLHESYVAELRFYFANPGTAENALQTAFMEKNIYWESPLICSYGPVQGLNLDSSPPKHLWTEESSSKFLFLHERYVVGTHWKHLVKAPDKRGFVCLC